MKAVQALADEKKIKNQMKKFFATGRSFFHLATLEATFHKTLSFSPEKIRLWTKTFLLAAQVSAQSIAYSFFLDQFFFELLFSLFFNSTYINHVFWQLVIANNFFRQKLAERTLKKTFFWRLLELNKLIVL